MTGALRISESGGRVRLGLDGFGDVDGATLQEAADALVVRLLQVAMALRSGGATPIYPSGCPDLADVEFVWRVGEHAARGRDPRDLLFG